MTNDIALYMQKETVKSRFSELMGNRNASAYISSVMLAVANQEGLQKCTPDSIYISALRAATLHLSVDQNLGQAYLVAFKNKKTGNDIATLIVGYKGLYDMAVRTGKYRYINVGHLYEGEIFDIDRISGFGSFGGGKTGDKVIGYFGAFEMVGGYAKTIYMSVDEIEAHAKKYSRNYSFEDSLWKKEHDKMCRKTVLRILIRKWGYIDPQDASTLEEIEADNDEVIEGETTEIVTNMGDEPQRTTAQAMNDLGFDTPSQTPTNPDLEKALTMHGSDNKSYKDCTMEDIERKMSVMSKHLQDETDANKQSNFQNHLEALKLVREYKVSESSDLPD